MTNENTHPAWCRVVEAHSREDCTHDPVGAHTHHVRVRAIRPPANEPLPNAGRMGSALVADGTMMDTGSPVTFVGDKRTMWDLQHALDDGAIVVAVVEDWQIIGRAN